MHYVTRDVGNISQNTLPEFTSVTDNCTYRFVWSVSAACPADVQPVVGDSCAVTDPATGMIMLHYISYEMHLRLMTVNS